MDLDATVSGAAANSYLTVAEADELLNAFPNADKWDEIEDPDDKARLLLRGTRIIDRYKEWPPGAKDGQRLVFPCTLDNPSTAIPERVKQALLEFVDYVLEGSLEQLKRLQAEGVSYTSILGQSASIGTDARQDQSLLPNGARRELDLLWSSYNAPRVVDRPYDGSADCKGIFE